MKTSWIVFLDFVRIDATAQESPGQNDLTGKVEYVNYGSITQAPLAITICICTHDILATLKTSLVIAVVFSVDYVCFAIHSVRSF